MPALDSVTTAAVEVIDHPPISIEKLFSWRTVIQLINTPIVRIGVSDLTLVSLFMAGAIVYLFVVLSRLVQRLLGPWLDRHLRHNPGISYAIQRFAHYLIVLVGLAFAAQFVGLNLSSFAIILGFLSVGIGFGMQNLTSNFISGLILLIERPISVGDLVQVDGQIGRVAEINMRSSVIQTLDNVSLIVPNSKFIENNVVNWSHGDP
ncbi:MAG: mechanosensitive ion channel, partial [bacterium]|nr:mechanosensitive ion channel [bacterium]